MSIRIKASWGSSAQHATALHGWSRSLLPQAAAPAAGLAGQHHTLPDQQLRVQASRQGPEPWSIEQPQLHHTTAWQQRSRQAAGQPRQQRPGMRGVRPQQQQQRRQQQQQPAGRFAHCSTYQQLHAALQQLVVPPPPPPQQGPLTQPIQAAQQQQQQQDPSATLHAHQQQVQAQQGAQAPSAVGPPEPAGQVPLLLSCQDLLGLMQQLAVIARKHHSSSSSRSGGSSSGGSRGTDSSSNPFVEDQALQHTLALAYALLDQQLLSQQQQPQQQAPARDARLSPQQLLRCVSTLAGLKYSQPLQLTTWLHAAAPGMLTPSPVPGPGATSAAGTGAVAAAGPVAVPGGGQQPAGLGEYRAVLSPLRMWELSGLVAHLAQAGARPSNTWLLALMQVAQQKLPDADLPQLAQLLSGLVKLGVKPTTTWLESMQARAAQCLLEQAVRQQVAEDQWQQHTQQQTQQPQQQQQGQRGPLNSSSRQPTSSSSASKGASAAAAAASSQLHHVALLLTALVEARHTPQPQLAAVMWGATAPSLAEAPAAAHMVSLIAAMAELQLLPPRAWLQQFFAASGAAAVVQQYKPWQLSSTVAAVGKLAAASRAAGPAIDQQVQQLLQQAGAQQEQQQRWLGCDADCQAWVYGLLAAVQQQLPAFAARDLCALLAGLTALQVEVPAAQLQLLLSELQAKLPRLNTAGLADVSEAVAALQHRGCSSRGRVQQQGQGQRQGQKGQQKQQQVQQQQQQQEEGAPPVTAGFVSALLNEVAVKLPVFPADDLARVLLAVQQGRAKPSALWLQAVAAQLSSKLTLLQPSTLLAVLDALTSMLGTPPNAQLLLQAACALDGQLEELSDRQLQRLLALLLAAEAAPPGAWLDRAEWAVRQVHTQQQVQQQQQQVQAGVVVAEAAQEQQQERQQQECGRLIAQLRQLRQQQQEDEQRRKVHVQAVAAAGGSGSSSSTSSAEL